jgi:hypothetical protein
VVKKWKLVYIFVSMVLLLIMYLMHR